MRRPFKKQPDNEYDPVKNPYPYLGGRERYLIGWPGYRTHPDKSGLGYIESVAEEGHLEGLCIRWLLTGKFKTRNPVYLVFISLTGVIFSYPLFFLLMLLYQGGSQLGFSWIIFAPPIVLGVLLLVSAVKGYFGEEDGGTITGD